MVDYMVHVFTSHVHHAGTDAHVSTRRCHHNLPVRNRTGVEVTPMAVASQVFLTLSGEQGDTGPRPLEHSSTNR
jgi:hypothetical protein